MLLFRIADAGHSVLKVKPVELGGDNMRYDVVGEVAAENAVLALRGHLTHMSFAGLHRGLALV